MGKVRRLVRAVVAGACVLALLAVACVWGKYRCFDRPRQLWYAYEIDMKKIATPDFPDTLVRWPMGTGNAADNYIRTAELMEMQREWTESLAEAYYVPYPSDKLTGFQMDQTILTELIEATNKDDSRFAPDYVFIPTDPADEWPYPFLALRHLGEVLVVAGDLALMQGDTSAAEESYGRALIMGQHLVQERFSTMQVMLGRMIASMGCGRLVELYDKTGDQDKRMIAERYRESLKRFHDELHRKSDAVDGKFTGGGDITLWGRDTVEIAVRVLEQDEDPMFRSKAALRLGGIKLWSLSWFESRRAWKALLAGKGDANPDVQNAVEYALNYSRADRKRELEAVKEMIQFFGAIGCSDTETEAIETLVDEEENPVRRQHLRRVFGLPPEQDK